MKVLQDLYTRIHAGSGAKPTSNQNVGTAKTKAFDDNIYNELVSVTGLFLSSW